MIWPFVLLQNKHHMKKACIVLALFLFTSLLALAQPALGDRYLELRQLYLNNNNNNDNRPFIGGQARSVSIGTTVGMGKMLSPTYSAGVLVQLGYLFTEQNASASDALQFGLLAYGRRWYDLGKKCKLHADMEAGYSASRPFETGVLNGNDQLSLGLQPGISWFFHPRWALQARIPLLGMSYSRQYGNGTDQWSTRLNYSPNLFSANWSMTFVLK